MSHRPDRPPFQRVFLRVVGREPELRKRGLHAVDDLSAQLRPALAPPVFETKIPLTSPGSVEKALCLGERQEQAGAVRGPALVLHDRLHLRGDEVGAGENTERVARVGPQFVCCVGR